MNTVVQMDRPRTFKYAMRGISFIEKKFNKPMGKIDFDNLTMEEIATVIQGGLVHEDKDIESKTPEDIMAIIDDKDCLGECLQAMSAAMKEMRAKQDSKNFQKAQK